MKKGTNRRKSDTQILKEIFPLVLLRITSTKAIKWLINVNRPSKPSHVNELAESINKMGIIRPVIMANLKLKDFLGQFIIDGQHLFLACLRLGIDIPVRFVEIKTEEELVKTLAMLNNTSKPWSLSDYVQSWSYIRPEYKILQEYYNTYGLELAPTAGILHQSPTIFNTLSIIKNGTLKIKDENKAVSIMEYVVDLLSVVPKTDRASSRRLVNGYVQYIMNNYDTYDHEEALENIEKNIKSLELSAANSETINEFLYTIL